MNYAGVLSDFGVLWICGQGVKLLDSHCQTGTHVMLAVRSPQHEVLACLDGIQVEIACINSPPETVVSGGNADIDLSTLQLDSKEIKYNRINVPYAFHSSQLQPVIDNFSRALNGLTIRTPKLPILSPLLSTVIRPGDNLGKDYLLRQCREAVNFVGAVRAGEAASILNDRTHVIEIGPTLVLARLMQRMMEKPPTIIFSLESNQDSWLVLSRSVASAYRVGCNINWAQYHRDYDHAIVQLPSYGWDLKDYWIPICSISVKLGHNLLPKVSLCRITGRCVLFAIESDLQSNDLRPVVGGHKVNGVAICIGAVYADMAFSCAESILKSFQNQEDMTNTVILVKDMDMQEALIISDSPEPQIVRIEAKYSRKQKKTEIEIRSASNKGQTNKIHAT